MKPGIAIASVGEDLRRGVRSLLRSPGYALIALLTLGVGIGSSVAIFSFVDAVLLKPLPYEHAERIVQLLERRPTGDTAWISTPNYLDWRNENTVFERIAALQQGLTTLEREEGPVPLRIARVTADYFGVFDPKPLLGRTFVAGEDEPGRDRVVVLSHAVWQREFGASPDVLGTSIRLDGSPYTVVGVLPADSAFDRGSAQIWQPLAFGPSNLQRDYRWLRTAFARLKPGVSLEQARSQMNAIGARIAADYPDSNRGWGVSLERYADAIVGPRVRLSLLSLAAAVAGLLSICCCNLASLAFVRVIGKESEVALCEALGASRTRIAQRFLMENLALGLGGGILGLLLAAGGVAWLRRLLPPGIFSSEARVALDQRVLLFALAATLLTTLLFGLAPALRAARRNLTDAIKAGGRGSGMSRSRRRLFDGLVVVEVAVAFLLLCGSALLVQSFVRLVEVDTGFDSSNVLTMTLPVPGFPPGSAYSSPDEFNAYLTQIQTAINALPEVRGSALTNALPLTDCCLYSLIMQIEGHPLADRANRASGFFKVVTPSYFETLHMTLRRGRFLDASDAAAGQPALVINERLAERYFPGEDAIGKRILSPAIIPGKTERGPEVAWRIVGIVANEKIDALNDDSSAVAYATYEQSPVYFANLVVRATVDVATIERRVRGTLYELNKSQAVLDVRPLAAIQSAALVNDRFETVLLGLFACASIALAALGIFGSLTYTVSKRMHELAVRGALGASSRGLRKLVLRRGLAVTIIGLAAGLAGALLLTPLLAPILYRVEAHDPYVLAAAAAALLLVSLIACSIPSYRAAAIDPARALRSS